MREPVKGLGIVTNDRAKLYVFAGREQFTTGKKTSAPPFAFPHLWPTLHNPKKRVALGDVLLVLRAARVRIWSRRSLVFSN